MVRCTVWLRGGAKVTFCRDTMLQAIWQIETLYGSICRVEAEEIQEKGGMHDG